MPQFDYTSNLMKPALDAVVTLNSGSMEPPSTAPYMLWMDTSATPAVFKQRNGGDTGWNALFMASNIIFNDGETKIQAANVQEAIEKIKALIDAHVDRKDNPHEVTAEQVGATPLGHKHTLSDITDAGEAAAMDRATEALVEEGVDNNTVVTPALMKKAIHTFGSRNTQLITEDCSFVVPAEKIWVEIAGGGGGGGGSFANGMHGYACGGSGGSGGNCMVEIGGLTVGDAVICKVGSGGTRNPNPAYPSHTPNPGVPGGESAFGDYVSCTGGTAGSSATNGFGSAGMSGRVVVTNEKNVVLMKDFSNCGIAGHRGVTPGGKSIFGSVYGAGGNSVYLSGHSSRDGQHGKPGAILVSW
ncbi:hypothetical protein [Salidesulfovibrio onnuriiensis]|uniref:glycine-rich domain-containing protein n=1 Tax=Salidesulfovibrio onnuriiensis TaxID=2583823 RepID=UPI0011C75118|nr:hypothetical protein [Salidesulfovibrio onnuriiensis]